MLSFISNNDLRKSIWCIESILQIVKLSSVTIRKLKIRNLIISFCVYSNSGHFECLSSNLNIIQILESLLFRFDISKLVNININVCIIQIKIINSSEVKSLNIFTSKINNSLIRLLIINALSSYISKIDSLWISIYVKISSNIAILININLTTSCRSPL